MLSSITSTTDCPTWRETLPLRFTVKTCWDTVYVVLSTVPEKIAERLEGQVTPDSVVTVAGIWIHGPGKIRGNSKR